MSTGLCEKCKFYQVFTPDEGEGQCRAKAPTPILGYEYPDDDISHAEDLLGRAAYWPVVSADDWCGEFVRVDES